MPTPPKKPASKTPRKPERPKNLPHGRWLGDFLDLSAAELRLVECCSDGQVWIPDGWDWQNPVRPEAESDANRIRADLIRFLALGGDALHPIHEAGLMMGGGWIGNKFTLDQCHELKRLSLKYCHFDSTASFKGADVADLDLTGSMVPGLNSDRMNVAGGVFLKDGFVATGEVRLLGAEIGGNLECDGGSFQNVGDDALSADGMKVSGDVFLRNGFKVEGEVRLLGAEIGGNLECGNSNFINVDGTALYADGIKVVGGVILRGAIIKGAVFLTAARVGTLADDVACWTSGGHSLDGLQYDRIIGPVDAASRIEWLKSQRSDHTTLDDWKPQPWEQLIKVMREMGHPGTAADIAMEKQRMMRKAGQIGTRIPRTDFSKPWRNRLDARWARLSNAIARGFHSFYGALAGYGHRPTRIAAWMLAVWLACSLIFEAGREYGHFGPSNPVINASSTLNDCGARGETNADGSPKAYWHSLSCPMPAEYTTLWPPLYSLDLILPLIDLQQDSDWAPIVVNENGEQQFWGYALRALMWFEILFGWLASLMFVAIVSRLVDKD